MDTEQVINQKLEQAKLKKSNLKENIESLKAKVNKNRKLISQAPRESEEEIEKTIANLEKSHATNPQTKAEETKFMLEKTKLSQKKKKVSLANKARAENNQYNLQISELKSNLLTIEGSINELSNGLKKIKTAKKLGCDSMEMNEVRLSVDESKIPQITGKGGTMIKSIERDHNVDIKIDDFQNIIRIMGKENSIQSATKAINEIIDTSYFEINPSDETLVCLLIEKAKLVNEIQDRHSVRIDVSRAKKSCKISGKTNQVEAAKDEILSIPSGRTDLLIESSILPFIIGKGGNTISMIEAEYHVSINLNRERKTVEIVGLKSNVYSASDKLKEIIDLNREIEEVISIEKHVLLGCLIGTGGQNIRAINNQFSVRIDTEGGKEDLIQKVILKGSQGKVIPAKAYIMKLIENFRNDSICFEIPTEYISVIVGKGGSGIKLIRDKYPNSNIDIENNKFYVKSSKKEEREAIRKEIESIVAANHLGIYLMKEDCIKLLKSSKGASLRSEITEKLNLKLILDKSNVDVKVRGLKSNVDIAISKLREFEMNFGEVVIEIPNDDYPILLNGGNDSIVRKIENKYDVTISTDRKGLKFTLYGNSDMVSKAKYHIEEYLSGNAEFGSQLVQLNNLIFSGLIGKNGANIKKMESKYHVKFDILKSLNKLRILGDKEKIVLAKKGVDNFINNLKVVDILDAKTKKMTNSDMLKTVTKLFPVEIKDNIENPSELVIKGIFFSVYPASVYLKDLIQDQYSYELHLLPQIFESFRVNLAENLARLAKKFHTSFDFLEKPIYAVTLRGSRSLTITAKHELIKIFQNFYPKEFFSFEMDSECLKEVFCYEFVSQIEDLGSKVSLDFEDSKVYLNCSQADSETIKSKIKEKINSWSETTTYIDVDPLLIPTIVGKNGATINSLRKDTKASVEIDDDSNRIILKASNKEALTKAQSLVIKKIQSLEAEHWAKEISTEIIPFLIGKQGATINKIRQDSGAAVEIDKSHNIIKVNGSQDQVIKAKSLILTIIENEESSNYVSEHLSVPYEAIPFLIGTKGSNAKDIQDKSNVRLDIDKPNSQCVLRGSAEACQKAKALIIDMLTSNGYSIKEENTADNKSSRKNSHDGENAEDSSEEPSNNSDNLFNFISKTSNLKSVPGASPGMLIKMQEKSLSKSALKRLRKKEKQKSDSSHPSGEVKSSQPSESPDLVEPSSNIEERRPSLLSLEEGELLPDENFEDEVETVDHIHPTSTLTKEVSYSPSSQIESLRSAFEKDAAIHLEKDAEIPVESMKADNLEDSGLQRMASSSSNSSIPEKPVSNDRLLDLLLGNESILPPQFQSASYSSDSLSPTTNSPYNVQSEYACETSNDTGKPLNQNAFSRFNPQVSLNSNSSVSTTSHYQPMSRESSSLNENSYFNPTGFGMGNIPPPPGLSPNSLSSNIFSHATNTSNSSNSHRPQNVFTFDNISNSQSMQSINNVGNRDGRNDFSHYSNSSFPISQSSQQFTDPSYHLHNRPLSHSYSDFDNQNQSRQSALRTQAFSNQFGSIDNKLSSRFNQPSHSNNNYYNRYPSSNQMGSLTTGGIMQGRNAQPNNNYQDVYSESNSQPPYFQQDIAAHLYLMNSQHYPHNQSIQTSHHQYSQNPSHSAAASSATNANKNYYKSKSGFSVRL